MSTSSRSWNWYRIETLVPGQRLLRKVDQTVYFCFMGEGVKHLYCEDNGRPARRGRFTNGAVEAEHLSDPKRALVERMSRRRCPAGKTIVRDPNSASHARIPLPSGGAAMAYRIAGIDVHKKMLAVVIADVAAEGEYRFERRRFGSGPQELRTLSGWLAEQHVEEVAMESTAQ